MPVFFVPQGFDVIVRMRQILKETYSIPKGKASDMNDKISMNPTLFPHKNTNSLLISCELLVKNLKCTVCFSFLSVSIVSFDQLSNTFPCFYLKNINTLLFERKYSNIYILPF